MLRQGSLLFVVCLAACKSDAPALGSAPPPSIARAPVPTVPTVSTTLEAGADHPRVPWEVLYEGNVACGPSVGTDDVSVVSYEDPDWFVDVVPRHGARTHWLGHRYMAVEECSVTEDAAAVYVVHAGVLVPDGCWGTIRRYERDSGKMTVFYRPKVPLRGAAVDGRSIFTIRDDVHYDAVRVDTTTGAATTVLSLPPDEQGYGIAVNRDSVFVAACRGPVFSVHPTNDSTSDCAIRRAPKAVRGRAGPGAVLRAKMGAAMFMHADDTSLYFTDTAGGVVGRVSLADGKTAILAHDEHGPTGIDVDDAQVYYAAAGRLMAVAKDGSSAPIVLDDTVNAALVQAQGDSLVVLTNGSPPRVLRTPKSALLRVAR